MCLAIPGQIVEIIDEDLQLAKVDVSGVRRTINISLVNDEDEQCQQAAAGDEDAHRATVRAEFAGFVAIVLGLCKERGRPAAQGRSTL